MSTKKQDHQQQAQTSNDENQLIDSPEQNEGSSTKTKNKTNKVYKPYYHRSSKHKYRINNQNNKNMYQHLSLSYQVQPFASPFPSTSPWSDRHSLMAPLQQIQLGHCCICSAYRSHSCAGKF